MKMDGNVVVYDAFEFTHIFNEFSYAVGQKKYSKLDYKIWKEIKEATNHALQWDLSVKMVTESINASGTTMYSVYKVILRASDENEYKYWEFMSDDNSFGEYLSDIWKEEYYKWIVDRPSWQSKDLVKLFEEHYNEIYDKDTETANDTLNRIFTEVESDKLADIYAEIPLENVKATHDGPTIIESKKEKDNMFKLNFDFGPVNSSCVRMSPFGMAIMATDGVWKSYNSKEKKIVDVDVFTFDASKFIYKMPVAIKDIQVGDVVIHDNNAVIVSAVNAESSTVSVVDVRHGETRNILPTYSPFGFDFITKVVPLIDMTGSANEDSPFGNMLPFLLMSDDKDIDPMMFFFMNNGGKNAFDFKSNPMMLYFLMKSGDKDKDLLPLMFLMNGAK